VEQSAYTSEQSVSASISTSLNDTLANIQACINTLEGELHHVKMTLVQGKQPPVVTLPNNNTSTIATTTAAHNTSSTMMTASTGSKNNHRSKELPTCDKLMNRPDLLVANGEFLTQQTTPNGS
jgi:hypothetical protein